MKKLLIALIITVLTSNSFAYYQAQQGRWISRDPLGEIRKTKDGYGNEKVLYKNPRLLYVFSNNSPINMYDVLGLECGVEICVRPLAVFPGGIPWWISPANHTYIQIGSWSAGFQSDDTVHIPETDPNHSGKKCFDAKRTNTGSMPDGTSCKCATCSDITKCIKDAAMTGSTVGGYPAYSWWSNNCGHWVMNSLSGCCMKGKIPWHYYGPNKGGTP